MPDLTEQQKDRKWILEREMATELAKADIGAYCVRKKVNGVLWFDHSDVGSGEEWEKEAFAQVSRAIEYLELREILTRHPKKMWITYAGAE